MGTSKKLALHGGTPVFNYRVPAYRSMGTEEREAALRVLDEGVLSKFLGASGEDFYGGPRVQEFEKNWASAFGTRYAISVNSCTSGLIAALGAIGLEPGDEVILSPWTMSADASAILVWNAIPVFADIESKTFNLDPSEVERKISSKTKAILVSDIFGQSAQLSELLLIAEKHKLIVIEDAAQAPLARYRNKYVGTWGHIGVFSLNYHKHIHTGEGGICVTNDQNLAEKMQMIRNHAESVVENRGSTDLSNMIGFNFRMGELEAAIGIEQLKKLPKLVEEKSLAGSNLTKILSTLPGLQTPSVLPEATHVYYVYPLMLDRRVTDIPRNLWVNALKAEGVSGLSEGYVNLHLLPMFQKKQAYGTKGFPWFFNGQKSTVTYEKGLCPVAEELQDFSFFKIGLCSYRFNEEDVRNVLLSFEKVWEAKAALVEK